MIAMEAHWRDEMMGESEENYWFLEVMIFECRTEGCSAEGREMERDYGARTDILISNKSIVWPEAPLGGID